MVEQQPSVAMRDNHTLPCSEGRFLQGFVTIKERYKKSIVLSGIFDFLIPSHLILIPLHFPLHTTYVTPNPR